MLASPSLDGILSHESIGYEGVARPEKILRAFDRPSSNSKKVPTKEEHNILNEYFQDLNVIFLKKFSNFVVESEPSSAEGLKLQAMLQEMIRIKGLLSRKDLEVK